VFVGGDGTARDVLDVVGTRVPVLGIPSGVKMHSAAFAASPEAGAVLVATFASNADNLIFHEVEVMDIDERLLAEDAIVAQLHGYLRVPFERRLVQAGKSRGVSASAQLDGAAREVVSGMEPGTLYLIGPGTSMRLVKRALGFEGTLLGVDAALDGRVAGMDLTERQILDLAAGRNVHIIVGLVGGQGFVFGRGNQQLSPEVIRRAGRDGITVLASIDKLLALEGAPLLVDTGDVALDRELNGFIRIVTGPGETTVMRVAEPPT
jgi:predicted polyphosphate/ATP-dependent NAD kinase